MRTRLSLAALAIVAVAGCATTDGGTAGEAPAKNTVLPVPMVATGSALAAAAGVDGYDYYTSTAQCTKPAVALSGGWVTDLAHPTHFQVVSSRRASPGGWRISVAVPAGSGVPKASAQAQCFPLADGSQVTEVPAGIDLAAGELVRAVQAERVLQTATAVCPEGRLRVGGGFEVTHPAVVVHTSGPWVAGVSGLPLAAVDPHAWIAGVFHARLATPQRLTAYAECLRGANVSGVRVALNSSYAPGEGLIVGPGEDYNYDQGFAACPSGTVAGGGYSYLGYTDSPDHITTNELVENGLDRAGTATGWLGRLFSRSGPQAEAPIFNTFAVCVSWLYVVDGQWCPRLYRCVVLDRFSANVFVWSPKFTVPVKVCWRVAEWPPADPLKVEDYSQCILPPAGVPPPRPGSGEPDCDRFQCVRLMDMDRPVLLVAPGSGKPSLVCRQTAPLPDKILATGKTASCA